VPAIDTYHRARYVGPNIVVAAAGHLDHDRILELSERHLSPPEEAAAPLPGGGPREAARLEFYAKDTEQYHVCFGAPGIARSDERRFALGVLDSILGGSTSSRLFREVREKRGLAYSVGTYSEQYVESGLVAAYVGTREENVAEACEIIGRELARLRAEGVDGEELGRAKEHVKGRMVLGLESTPARMSRLARAVLYDLELLSVDELLARIDAVSEQDVASLAAELWDAERLSAACIGPEEERFREAIGPVSEPLAAA
jgi:predicted Zn-dependent peptidase